VPDIASFTLELVAAEGTQANEPNAIVTFLRTDNTAIVTARHVVFPPARSFTLPAWPSENALYCDVAPSLYRPLKSDFFVPRVTDPQQCRVFAFRDPERWEPTFVHFGNLPGDRFEAFQRVASLSDDVIMKHGPAIGKLDSAYDNLTGFGDPAVLAKMCLLNLFAVLTDEVEPVGGEHWFSFIQKIVLIDRERFTAEVDEQLYVVVKKVLADLDKYKQQGYFTESAALHYDNIPQGYKPTSDMITVKVRYQQGNVQFTMCTARKDDKNVHLLDCDMDEHSNVVEHGADLFKHVFTGGTHPIDMHEYILRHSAKNSGGVARVVLGYDLEPIS
jgi:hypothetical protein